MVSLGIILNSSEIGQDWDYCFMVSLGDFLKQLGNRSGL